MAFTIVILIAYFVGTPSDVLVAAGESVAASCPATSAVSAAVWAARGAFPSSRALHLVSRLHGRRDLLHLLEKQEKDLC